jgi:hypothetical protein
VLELPTRATWSEIERRADTLREALRSTDAIDSYPTPAGSRRRIAADIDAAVEALRDPDARLVHELWAAVPPRREPKTADAAMPGWSQAMTAFGWRRP